MKANELRIGNFVDVINYKTIKLENVHKKGCTIGDEQYLMAMLKPIPLTEEWLKKLGFKSSFATDPQIECASKQFDFNGFIVYMPNENKEEFIYSSCMEIIDLKHVHQLQNLHFALTGEEIIIK